MLVLEGLLYDIARLSIKSKFKVPLVQDRACIKTLSHVCSGRLHFWHVNVGFAVHKHSVGRMGRCGHGNSVQSIAAYHTFRTWGAYTITRVDCIGHGPPHEP